MFAYALGLPVYGQTARIDLPANIVGVSIGSRATIEWMSKLSDFLNDEIEERGWSKRELARRSGISSAQVTDVMNERAQAGAEFCVSVARALGEDPEDMLRLAGILPPLPPAVREEGEALRLFRSFDPQAREVILVTLRCLLGLHGSLSRAVEEQPAARDGGHGDRPHTFSEWLAWHIARNGKTMTREEWRQVCDLASLVQETNEGQA
jgi:transcriptional regulator with XRE-family HTH domain